ncbi:MAG: glutamate--tRNA ligase [Candidatus Marinimicrobia bacterium]|nr:glutamate--tRNA ligase [Candidatus Neomarinimicrobiota bacterium]
MNSVVRFAPSPTGKLHIGGVRTALFNYLFAKRHDGKFLVRIEDTDKERSKAEYTAQILESLKWLGLDYDEEPIAQSSRGKRYNEVIESLLKSGKAYRCFATNDELQALRDNDKIFLYPGIWRDRKKEEIDKKLKDNVPFTIRLRVPEEGVVSFKDEVYGTITTKISELDDFIIARSDGSPTYNLTVVVDDNDMNISHVIRGEDHISNTPKQILIYNALGWDLPVFGHLPMILGSDGKRLSKRHGAVGTQTFKDMGYLPESLINYLALLGWNPGNNDEIFDINYLINNFSIQNVNKKSAVFDMTKLDWVSSQKILAKKSSELLELINDFDSSWSSGNRNNDFLVKVIEIIKDRLKTLSDVKDHSYFFKDPTGFDEDALKKCWKEPTNGIMDQFLSKLKKLDGWNVKIIDDLIRQCVEELSIGMGKLMQPLRLALAGALVGPSMPDLMDVLGKEVCIKRLENILELKQL